MEMNYIPLLPDRTDLLLVNIRAILLKFILQNMTIMNRERFHKRSLGNLNRLSADNYNESLCLEKILSEKVGKIMDHILLLFIN